MDRLYYITEDKAIAAGETAFPDYEIHAAQDLARGWYYLLGRPKAATEAKPLVIQLHRDGLGRLRGKAGYEGSPQTELLPDDAEKLYELATGQKEG